jgi:hypothetical protein
MRKLFIVLMLVFLLPIFGFTQERFVMPVDEAKQDPSFFAFRTKLIAAVDRKDAAYVLSIIDPKIEFSYGGEVGITQFKKEWKQLNKNSEFWNEFAVVIKNGGHFIGEGRNRLSEFAAPYTFNGFPSDLDGVGNLAIFGSDVNLRKQPNMGSEVVAKLSYNIVELVEDDKNTAEDQLKSGWYRIKTLGGMTGYVKTDFVRADIDYRAGFQKKRGVWKMTFFIAGD